ncbi:MAG: hypothetical protein E6J45_00610 [Chloroflexi bacterium]|nr:MAG: hypothetical protein E6J45_00610 [Chloroflexota bacterium]
MRALIVDGYNIIHALPALKRALLEHGLQESRRRLIDALAAYAADGDVRVTVVFDAGARRSGEPTVEVVDGVTVRFGTQRSTADHIIERLAYQASRRGEGIDLVVATDDRLQRDVVSAMGVATMRSRALDEELRRAAAVTEHHAQRLRDQGRATERLAQRLDPEVARRLEAMRRGRQVPDAGEDA